MKADEVRVAAILVAQKQIVGRALVELELCLGISAAVGRPVRSIGSETSMSP
jgi:hypothetical protein